jgi:hypothetical protein
MSTPRSNPSDQKRRPESALASVKYGTCALEIDTPTAAARGPLQQIRNPEFNAVGGPERHGLHVAGADISVTR